MIHLLQAEYDELVAAREALAVLRGEQNLSDYAKQRMPMAQRALILKELAKALVSDATAMGMHLTIERHMDSFPPSMGGLRYAIECWPDQRKTTP